MAELVHEGLVEIELGHGVFYNPRMELSRDIGTAALRAYGVKDKTYADVMCATGIRGLRAAKEAGADVTLNDADPGATELARKNAVRNGVVAEVICRKAGALLFERRFDVVDLDPYGSPVPVLTPAVYAARDLLAVTATDTAPLCGAHRAAGVRRYMSAPMRTDYHGEVGLRTFVCAVVREAARIDRAARPLFAYIYSHHVRGYFEMANGAGKADEMLGSVGFLLHCPACQNRVFAAGTLPPPVRECPVCGETPAPIGPLWGGPLRDGKYLSRVRKELVSSRPNRGFEALQLAELCNDELDVPFHYDQHRMAKELGTSPQKMASLLENLNRQGYDASRTHFSPVGFKTDAPLPVIKDALRSGKES